MSTGPELSTNDDFELSLETLDQWETELDQFAAGIMKRLSDASGKTIDVSGLIPQHQPADQNRAANQDGALQADENSEALRLLKSLRDMSQ
ncbi:hypothetical protein [Stieleria mannarensis]|uniref:hypothetical protein n=1 Tax=Stieleria mannarensis TaxID=2755585 RepID=UPI0016032995|nr:hypothetical protein [Rhodopirellula sp. JC639]